MAKHTGTWKQVITDKVCKAGGGYCHPACLRTDALEDQKGFKGAKAVEDAVKPYEKGKPVRQMTDPDYKGKGA